MSKGEARFPRRNGRRRRIDYAGINHPRIGCHILADVMVLTPERGESHPAAPDLLPAARMDQATTTILALVRHVQPGTATGRWPLYCACLKACFFGKNPSDQRERVAGAGATALFGWRPCRRLWS